MKTTPVDSAPGAVNDDAAEGVKRTAEVLWS